MFLDMYFTKNYLEAALLKHSRDPRRNGLQNKKRKKKMLNLQFQITKSQIKILSKFLAHKLFTYNLLLTHNKGEKKMLKHCLSNIDQVTKVCKLNVIMIICDNIVFHFLEKENGFINSFKKKGIANKEITK